MGVPKFYRWLSERYPCLSEVVKENMIPEFDNLYLDMNGVIHICSHPNDDDPHFRITEEKIFESIFHYIEFLFRMIQPQKVFFMAVDGVAPRAKMNQQRGRRFRSAKEAELNEKKAKDRGEELPKEARFDSNCITPGTPFMVRLNDQLKYFVSMKQSTDPLWKKVKVILSGHETPGEGEHKIMDFIRHERAKPSYDPNIRHCLYGLDADLMMLGMSTHDPHFSLLREEVKFGNKKVGASAKRTPTPEETTFHLLHLSLLREYIDHEFRADLEDKLPFEYDLEGIIDDWIMLGFLVGNDFIPHLPHMHINKGALTELYATYKTVLPSLGGYINEKGKLNLERFEKFMISLSDKELERFDDIYSDSKWIEGKSAVKASNGKHLIKATPGPGNAPDMLSLDAVIEEPGWEVIPSNKSKKPPVSSKRNSELQKLLASADEFLDDDNVGLFSTADETLKNPQEGNSTLVPDEEGNDEDDTESSTSGSSRNSNYHMEFRQHKREYYIGKLGYQKVDGSVLKEQAECYVRAIQWCLYYYYDGCASWSWYYPHHFAPWITDIRNFSDGSFKLEYELSQPFLPFEQLLAVLPAASKELLPESLQGLMINETSPIIDYYPKDFESDLNGKQQDWEAVVLIPFIDENRLLEAMRPLLKSMRPDEVQRNVHGPMHIFTYSDKQLGEYFAPAYFPKVVQNRAKLIEVLRCEWDVPRSQLRKGILPNVRENVFFPGFPTLNHIPHEAKLENASVRVFEQASRGQNMMLKLKNSEVSDQSLATVADEYLGKEVWVAWPHMIQAKVMSVSTINEEIKIGKNGEFVTTIVEDDSDFKGKKKLVTDRYKNRWGVDIGPTKILLNSTVMIGRKYVFGIKGRITLEKEWAKIPQPYALQAVKKDILVHDPSFTQFRTIGELFPIGSICFMIGETNFAAEGFVTEIVNEKKGKIQLKFIEEPEPDLEQVKKDKSRLATKFFPGYRVAKMLGISFYVLSRLTGSVFVSKSAKETAADRASRYNIGLSLKLNKRNEEVIGFTRKLVLENQWTFSQRSVDILKEYIQKYPEVFELVSMAKNGGTDMFHISDLFPNLPYDEAADKISKLSSWLSELPSANAPRQECGTDSLDEAVVNRIEEIVDAQRPPETGGAGKRKCTTMQVKTNLLYKPDLHSGKSMAVPSVNFKLFDRVVNVREGHCVPLGLRGTVTGIHNTQATSAEEMYVDVLFDKVFTGGVAIRSSRDRSYRLPAYAVLNITHGLKRPAKTASVEEEQSQGEYQRRNNNNTYHGRQRYPQQQQQQQRNTSHKEHQHTTAPFVAPPDPKTLPNPNDIFKPRQKKQTQQQHQQQSNLPQPDLKLLWNNLAAAQQPAIEPQPQPSSQLSPDSMSQQLKNMLNIAQGQPPQQQSHVGGSAQELLTFLQDNNLGKPSYRLRYDDRQNGRVLGNLNLPWSGTPRFFVQGFFYDYDSASDNLAAQGLNFIRLNGFPSGNTESEQQDFKPRGRRNEQPQASGNPTGRGAAIATKPSHSQFIPSQVMRKTHQQKKQSKELEGNPEDDVIPPTPQQIKRVQEWVDQSTTPENQSQSFKRK